MTAVTQENSPTTIPKDDRPSMTTQAPGHAGWLVSAPVDLLLVFGLGAALSVVLYASWRLGTGFLVIAAMFAVVSDFPHVLQTSVRVWMDPVERRLHGRHFVLSLAAIGLVVATLAGTGNFILVIAIFVVWQVLHVIKQHIGMMSIYATKAGYRGDRNLVKRVLVIGCLAPVLFRASEGLRFGHYELNGSALPFSGMTVPLPSLLVWLAYGGFALALLMFVNQQRSLRRSGKRTMPMPALLTVGVAVVFYNASYHLVSDPYALILIATTFHSLQYHLISWARNRGRFTANASAEDQKLLLARLSTPRALLVLAPMLVLVGAVLAAGETVLLGVIPFSIVLHHFYLDGVLWKPSHNPGLAKDLSLRPAA